VKRQLKTYTITLGRTTTHEDNPNVGTLAVIATDAVAAGAKVPLGKRDYISQIVLGTEVLTLPVEVNAPAPPNPFDRGEAVVDVEKFFATQGIGPAVSPTPATSENWDQ
jgi:hypothetical protein